MSDDDFLEERFGEFNRALLEDQVREHDATKPTGFDKQYVTRQLTFIGKIPEKAVAILKRLVPDILNFSSLNGLSLRDQNHQIAFYSKSAFETEFDKTIPAGISLPASQLQYNSVSNVYTVNVILPEKIQTNEEVINITRSLFSKFIGDIYLNEQVLSKEFYRNASRAQDSSWEIPFMNKLEVIANNDFPSQVFKALGQKYAKQYRMNLKVQWKAIRQDLVKEWQRKFTQQQMRTDDEQLIERIFEDFLEDIRLHSDNALGNVIQQLETLNKQLHFILPHEIRAYHSFEEASQNQYIQSATSKIEEILAKIGFIEEVYSQLEESQDPEVLEGMYEQIQWQISQLKKEGKVRLFLIPNLRLGPQLQNEQQQFSLRLIKLLPKNLPVAEWGKQVASMQKKYQNSIYQKIVEALIYLKHWVVAHADREPARFLESEESKKLKQLLQNLKYREEMLAKTNLTLGTVHDYSESLKFQSKENVFPINAFKKAWSYTISCILIHCYYDFMNQRSNATRKFNSARYLKAIVQFVSQQMNRGVDYATIATLMLDIYQNQKNGLAYLLYIVHNPVASFQHALCQILQEPKAPKSMSKPEQIKHYRELLISVYNARYQDDIIQGRDY